MAQDYTSLTIAGFTMTDQAARELEQKVSINPDDELSRITLMGYYPKRAIWNKQDREKCIGCIGV